MEGKSVLSLMSFSSPVGGKLEETFLLAHLRLAV